MCTTFLGFAKVEPFGGLPYLTPLGFSLTSIALSFAPWLSNLISNLKEIVTIWSCELLPNNFVPSKFPRIDVVISISH